MNVELGDNLFMVSGLLTEDECLGLIARGEAIGFQQAAVRTPSGPQMRPNVRDNDRAEFTDAELAASLWQRCLTFVPQMLEGGEATELESEFRFYRYDLKVSHYTTWGEGANRRTTTPLG